MAVDNDYRLRIGQRLGGYQIEAMIGEGGMGVVYCASDRTLGRKVAIKVVDRRDGRARRSLLQEARIAASLNHPAICSVHEVGCVNDQPFIVMEHVVGSPLTALLRPGKGLPLESAIHYALQIADAVAHAHSRGVVHCDLKSSNIMIAVDGAVKILDFGLAVREPVERDANQIDTTECHEAPSGAGTVPYMAPEILRGQRPNARSDVWALGVVLYEMMTGARPFPGITKYELAAAILSHPPAPMSSRLPITLRQVVLRCLEKDPGRRYRCARGLASALDDLA